MATSTTLVLTTYHFGFAPQKMPLGLPEASCSGQILTATHFISVTLPPCQLLLLDPASSTISNKDVLIITLHFGSAGSMPLQKTARSVLFLGEI